MTRRKRRRHPSTSSSSSSASASTSAFGEYHSESEFSDDDDHDAFRFEDDVQRRYYARTIRRVKHNHPSGSRCVSLGLIRSFTTKSWERLGDYVSRNEYVECLSLRRCNLDDADVSVFFGGSSSSSSSVAGGGGGASSRTTKVLALLGNSFGPDGARCLSTYLRSACSLTSLNVSGNDIGSVGLRWLARGLDSGPIEKLNLRRCGLSDVYGLVEVGYSSSSLSGSEGGGGGGRTLSLPRLQVLYLCDNGELGKRRATTGDDDVGGGGGRGGCESVATFLRHGASRLRKLYLNRCAVGDGGAEVVAGALVEDGEGNDRRSSSVLVHLELGGNDIGKRGQLALLRLVNDVSSLERTYHSNHVLRLIDLKGNAITPIGDYIEEALGINRNHQQGCDGVVGGAGRAKVIRYHLNSHNRRALSALQGVGDHFMRSFVRIDPSILPELVALVERESGMSDAYRLIVEKNSELWRGRHSRDERKSTMEDVHGDMNADVIVHRTGISETRGSENE